MQLVQIRKKRSDAFTQRIMNIKQAKINGEVIVAKPVLLLALIDGVEKGVFGSNHFMLNEWLEERYFSLMKQYTKNSQFEVLSPISNPFWHLQSDGFWHLQLKNGHEGKATPSIAWLKDNVEFARFDDDLWVLLQNQEKRIYLRDFIIEQKLTIK